MRILIPFYSMYGHVYKMALAAAAGVEEIDGCEGILRRVPETLSPEILIRMGAEASQAEMAHIPVCTVPELAEAHAIIFGTPTRFGNMCGQMRQFLDATGGLWVKHALTGKPAAVFTSSGTQHGGQESTILSFHTTLLHHGMIIVGLPNSFPGLNTVSEVSGGSYYGASTIAGPGNQRQPSANELDGARFLGRHLASITVKLNS